MLRFIVNRLLWKLLGRTVGRRNARRAKQIQRTTRIARRLTR